MKVFSALVIVLSLGLAVSAFKGPITYMKEKLQAKCNKHKEVQAQVQPQEAQTQVQAAKHDQTLRARFSTDPSEVGKTSFKSMPHTEDQAKTQGWRHISSDEFTSMYCDALDDKVCLKYDKKGTIAGMTLNIPQKVDSLKIGFDFPAMGFTPLTIGNTDYWSLSMSYVNEEILKAGGREWDGQVIKDLCLPTGPNVCNKPPMDKNLVDEVENKMLAQNWTKQNCFDAMGNHYFYALHYDDYNPSIYRPYFILYDDSGKLIGYGFVSCGSNVEENKQTGWWEPLKSFVIQMIAPACKQWLKTCIDDMGPYSMHVYATEKGAEPWTIKCKKPTQGAY